MRGEEEPAEEPVEGGDGMDGKEGEGKKRARRKKKEGDVVEGDVAAAVQGQKDLAKAAPDMLTAERRVFEGLGLEWRAPEERCTG